MRTFPDDLIFYMIKQNDGDVSSVVFMSNLNLGIII